MELAQIVDALLEQSNAAFDRHVTAAAANDQRQSAIELEKHVAFRHAAKIVRSAGRL